MASLQRNHAVVQHSKSSKSWYVSNLLARTRVCACIISNDLLRFQISDTDKVNNTRRNRAPPDVAHRTSLNICALREFRLQSYATEIFWAIMTSNVHFSAIQRHSSPSSCAFSPGSSLYAAAFDDHIIVRFTEDMQPATHFVCALDQQEVPEGSDNVQIKHLTWRFDSKYLLASDPHLGVVWVFAITDASKEPRAVIRAGVEGFVRCEWSGAGTEVLCFSDNGVGTVSVSIRFRSR